MAHGLVLAMHAILYKDFLFYFFYLNIIFTFLVQLPATKWVHSLIRNWKKLTGIDRKCINIYIF